MVALSLFGLLACSDICEIPLSTELWYSPNIKSRGTSVVRSEAPESETEIIRRGTEMLAERLPAGWSSRVRSTAAPIDGVLEICDEGGTSAVLVIEAKRIVEGRDVASIQEQFTAYAQQLADAQGLVIARYLSPSVRAKLTEAGLSFIDATGNMRVELSSPGLFVSDRGADRDPWRGPGRPRGTLKGEPAAKVVRAIADFAGTWTMRELVDASSASTGASYRVVEFLEREGMATRDSNGRVSVPDWAQLLRRWSDDYGFVRNNQVTRWIAPRGLDDLTKRLASSAKSIRYVVTGTIAAAEWAAYAPARLGMVYVDDASDAARAWDLRPTDAGANVILAEPKYDVVFERSLLSPGGVTVAAPSQVVVDLMTGPGRNPSEAEELLKWMVRNEQSWRN